MSSEAELETEDLEVTRARHRIPTWTERHGLKLLGAIMVTMFATVIVAQVGC
jgi:hypothetical protein